MVITITVNFPERRYMEYNRKSYPINQYVINLGVSLPIKISLGVFINLSERPKLLWLYKYTVNTLNLTLQIVNFFRILTNNF
jgi:hypothetical protein